MLSREANEHHLPFSELRRDHRRAAREVLLADEPTALQQLAIRFHALGGEAGTALGGRVRSAAAAASRAARRAAASTPSSGSRRLARDRRGRIVRKDQNVVLRVQTALFNLGIEDRRVREPE